MFDHLDFTEIENKYGRLSKSKKQRIERTLKLGKSVLYVPDFDLPPTMKCYYLNNFAVWTDLEDNNKVIKTFSNHRAKKDNRDNEVFKIKKPIRINDRDGVHVLGRRMGRVISKTEVLNCLANGIHVKNFSKKPRKNAPDYVFYDRYYFFDDVGVVASETANYINVRTLYRTTAIADYGFLEMVPDLVDELKISENSFSQFRIINNTGRLRFLQTKEHQEMQVVAYTLNGHNPYIQGAKLETFAKGLKESGELDKLTLAVVEKRLECNDVEYTHTSNDNDSLPIEEFRLQMGQNYAIEFTFEVPSEDGLTKKQKSALVDYGLIIEKYPHESNVFRKTVEGKEVFHAKIKFDMSNFSAAENPWAIRRKNNLHVLD